MSISYSLLDTWNAGATTFTGIGLDITDTASSAGSLLIDLQVGSVSQFSVTKAGAITNGTLALSKVTGLGTGVATALAINVGSAGAPVVNGGAGGTPSSLTLTNATGLPAATGLSDFASFETTAALAATTVPASVDVILLHGHTAAGDWGDPVIFTRQGSNPTYGPKYQDAASVWWQGQPTVLSVNHFGAFGDPKTTVHASATDETTAMRAAFDAHLGRGIPLYIPGGRRYTYDGYQQSSAYTLDIYSDNSDWAELWTLEPDDASSVTRYHLNLFPTTMIVDWGSIIAANVAPGDTRITLSSTAYAAVSVGDILQIQSDEVYPYEPTAGIFCGEIHVIKKKLGSDIVEIGDFARDNYNSSNNTIIGRVWRPNKASIRNIRFISGPQASGTTGFGNVRLFYTKDARVENCSFEGGPSEGLNLFFPVGFRGKNIENERFGGFDSSTFTGYPINVRSCLDMKIENVFGHNARDCAINFDTASGVNSTPCRDVELIGFNGYGGGSGAVGTTDFFPNGSEVNRVISTHAPMENLTIRGGIMGGCQNPIRIRSHNTLIEGVTFVGKMLYPVYANAGAGLTIRNCVYRRNDHPKTDSVTTMSATDHPTALLGIGGTTAASEWFYEDGATVIDGFEADAAFSIVEFNGDWDPSNVRISNIDLIVTVANASSINLINAINEGGGITMTESIIDWSSIRVRNLGAGTVNPVDSTIDVSSLILLTKTDNYALTGVDLHKPTLEMNSGSDKTITVPVDTTYCFPIGWGIDIVRKGSGEVAVAAESGSITVDSSGSALRLHSQYSAARLYKAAANSWILAGDLKV